MDAINIADAQAYLRELVDRVEAGMSFAITRGGKSVARLVPIARSAKPIDLASLRNLADTLPFRAVSAGQLVRTMRDNDRA